MKVYNEKYRNKISTVIALFLFIAYLTLSINQYYSTQWLDFNISDKIGDAVSSIGDEMFEGIGSIISALVDSTGATLVKGMVKNFGPNMAAFERFASSGDVSPLSETATSVGATHASKFIAIAQVTGYTIATIVLFMSLIIFFITPRTEVKDTPLWLIFRYILAVLLISNAPGVMRIIMDIADNLWSNYVMTSVASGQTKELSYDALLVTEYATGEGLVGKNLKIFGQVAEGAAKTVFSNSLPVLSIGPILSLLLAWPIIKNFVKLYIEIIERYLVVVLLYLCFGAAAATIVSKNSSNIFKSYFRMLGCQILLLFMNTVFMTIIVEVFINGGHKASIPNYIFTIAFLQTAQRVDSYMQSLGLSVAQTGGATVDALTGSTRGMINALRTTGRAYQGAMGLGAQAAIGAGRGKLAGTLMAASGISGATMVAAKGGVLQAGLDATAAAGKQMAVNSPKEAAGIITDMMNNPASHVTTGRVGAMDDNSLINGINQHFADNGIRMKVTDVDRKMLRGGQIGFSAKALDDNGNIINDSPEIKGSLSASGGSSNAEGLTLSNSSDSIKLTTQNALKNMPDEKVHGNADQLALMSGTAETMSSADDDFKNKIDSMSYSPDNGGQYALFDKNENQIGTISNVKGNMRLSQSMGQAATGDKNSFKNALDRDKDGNMSPMTAQIAKDNNLKDIQWDKQGKNGTATGVAKQVDEYGNEKDVRIACKDVGARGYNGGKLSTYKTDDGKSYAMTTKIDALGTKETAASKKKNFGSDPNNGGSPSGGSPSGGGPSGGSPNGGNPSGGSPNGGIPSGGGSNGGESSGGGSDSAGPNSSSPNSGKTNNPSGTNPLNGGSPNNGSGPSSSNPSNGGTNNSNPKNGGSNNPSSANPLKGGSPNSSNSSTNNSNSNKNKKNNANGTNPLNGGSPNNKTNKASTSPHSNSTKGTAQSNGSANLNGSSVNSGKQQNNENINGSNNKNSGKKPIGGEPAKSNFNNTKTGNNKRGPQFTPDNKSQNNATNLNGGGSIPNKTGSNNNNQNNTKPIGGEPSQNNSSMNGSPKNESSTGSDNSSDKESGQYFRPPLEEPQQEPQNVLYSEPNTTNYDSRPDNNINKRDRESRENSQKQLSDIIKEDKGDYP